MGTPIASRYSTSSAISSSPPSSLAGSSSRKSNRLSVQPGDDPFAAHMRGAGDFAPALGGEEWRISEESTFAAEEREEVGNGQPAADGAVQVDKQQGIRGGKKVERRPSFLRGLLKRSSSRSSVLSSSVSTTSISAPVLNAENPPRLGPVRSSASLVSLVTASAQYDSRRNSYASGSTSLRGPSEQQRRNGARTPIYETFGGSLRGGEQGGRPLSRASSLNALSSEARRERRERERPEDMAKEQPHPPTESSKAFKMLGGSNITTSNRKGVERLTGIRNSQVGLALTTDAPTRHFVPDNARLSIFSTSTAASGDRSTLYSAASSDFGDRQRVMSGFSSVPSVYDVVEEDEGAERYDPATEDGEAASLHRQGASTITRGVQEVKPPVPPRSAAREGGHSASNSASSGRTAQAGAEPGSRLRSQQQHPIITHTQGSPHRAPNPSSRLNSKSSSKSLSAPIPPSLGPSPPRASLSELAASTDTLQQTLASAYIVAGLPKDPSTWTLADHSDPNTPRPDHSLNAVPRYWRPEMLGCTTTGDGKSEGEGMRSLDGEAGSGRKGRSSGKGKEGKAEREAFVTLTKAEVASIQGMAIKLAFNREVEVMASTTQPASTMSHFHFTVASSSSSNSSSNSRPFAGSTALARDASLAPPSSLNSLPSSTNNTRTYYASALIVWSHADAPRSEAIRATLEGGARAKSAAVQRAVKAAKAGRKLGERLSRQLSSPMGAVVEDGVGWNRGAVSDTEGEATESEWGDSVAASSVLAHLTPATPFWLPYALILVSHAPVYNLLTDIVRISWARYHQDIASHSLQMQQVLHFPAPRVGDKIRLPVSVSTAQDTFFVATMPGKIDWTAGAAREVNFAMWPVVRALHADNLLTIAEIALSPLGRVLFVSRHSIMLGLAVSMFQCILEMRGWRGITHTSVHARDLKIYVEDPGPWLIGIPILSRSIALAELTQEVAVVDLDTNSVTCARTAPGALSTGSARDKNRRRLEAAMGTVGPHLGVPPEVTEAFPNGRFRPFSDVEVGGVPKDAERLRPAPSWNWDQARFVKEFDSILAEQPRTGLARFFAPKKSRRVAELDPSAQHIQSVVRKHANTFVDRRDLLESKINKLNSKLAALMAESTEWSRNFDVFKEFSDKLTKESIELKTRLEKERREARRLTGQMTVEKKRQARLEARLTATDQAREQALLELSNVQHVRANLEEQRSLLMNEMQAILAADDETSPLYESVYSRIEALSQRSETSSRPGSAHSMRSSSRLGRASFAGEEELAPLEEEEDEEEMLHTESTAGGHHELGEEERLEAMKQAVQETLRSIQSRLSIVLQNAGQLEAGQQARLESSASNYGLQSHDNAAVNPRAARRISASPTPPTLPLPDTPPLSNVGSPSQAEMNESFSTAPDPDSSFILREHKPRRFQPRAFQLTPPVSPELSTTAGGPPPFVTTERGGGGRRGQHRATDSVASTWTANVSTASTSTPTTATPDRPFPSSSAMSRTRSPTFEDRPTSSLNHHASQNSFGQDARYGTPSRTSDYGDWDDGQSFARASEGFGSRPGSAASSRSEPEEEDGDVERTERVRATSAQSVFTEEFSHQKGGEDDATYQHSAHHQRSNSAATTAGVDSPPVELFTRAMSPNGGRRRDGSVDLRGIGGGVGGGGRLAPERFAPWRAGGERPVSTATVKPVRRA